MTPLNTTMLGPIGEDRATVNADITRGALKLLAKESTDAREFSALMALVAHGTPATLAKLMWLLK